MAQSVAVVRGTLPNSTGFVDLTSAGFGTVAAAVVIACDANTTNNPEAPARMSVGFWDGTRQRVCAFTNEDNSGTSRTFRHSSDSQGVILPLAHNVSQCNYGISAVTNGIRLTLQEDNTTVDRYVTVLLLGGVSAKIVDIDATTQNGTTESASLGFAPTAAMIASIGYAAQTNVKDYAGIMSFGVATAAGANYGTLIGEFNSVSPSRPAQKFCNDRCCGQVYNYALTWAGEVTAWGSDTLTLTTRDGPSGSDRVFCLALGGDVSIQAGELTTPTSTGNADVTTTVDPAAVLISAQTATSTTLETGGNAEGWSLGMSDGTNDYSHNMTTGDNLSTSNTQSAAQADRVIDVDFESSGFSPLVDASVDSFGTAKYTLNYSAVSGTARKGWWVAFGPATGGGSLTIRQGLSKIKHGAVQSLHAIEAGAV